MQRYHADMFPFHYVDAVDNVCGDSECTNEHVYLVTDAELREAFEAGAKAESDAYATSEWEDFDEWLDRMYRQPSRVRVVADALADHLRTELDIPAWVNPEPK